MRSWPWRSLPCCTVGGNIVILSHHPILNVRGRYVSYPLARPPGAYEISNDVYFSGNRLSLLDRGWAFGIAHVRGGGDLGRLWYEDGKYLKVRGLRQQRMFAAGSIESNKGEIPAAAGARVANV